ncbi:hypothetical protein D6856_00865 [Butyrivibrio sp. XB500-5]|uniref:hypothetical protein n=1 Tax=Butyrivibrio sp. XB500-5 TaxID=2364880 RepID=UPI000EA8E23C|nr:hypothetical protein [Butyrivibrio sp. XB500-5]RKM62708.1 hypothetical protein D6856_00865 [Butyrivibrio sp. XB500-5]
MKIKGILKRGLSFAMVFSMAASVLVGCGNSKKKNEESVLQKESSGSKEYVYKTEDINLDGIDFEGANICGLKSVGDKIELVATYKDGNAKVVTFNPDGTDVQSSDFSINKDEELSYVTIDNDGGFYALREAPKGGDASSEASTDEDLPTASDKFSVENKDLFIEQYDASGKVVNSFACPDKSAGGYNFNVFNLAISGDGKLYVADTEGIQEVSFDGGLKTVIDTQKSDSPYKESYFRIYDGKDNQIYAYDFGGTDNVFKFDPAKGELSEPLEELNEVTDFGISFFGGAGYDLYISTGEAIYGYSAEKKEAVKLINYIDSAIELDSGISTMTAVGDGEIVGAIPGFDYKYSLVRLTKVPTDQVKDKKIITLGGIAIDWRVSQEAIKFNRTNDEYQIKIVDYSNGENTVDGSHDEAIQKFDMDIVSGNIPDIMVFFDEQPYKKYQNKGLFYDLKPLFDKDEDLKGIKFLPNMEKAMMTDDGKLYSVFNEFLIGTVLAGQKNTGDKKTLSYKDCDDIISQTGNKYDLAFGPMDQNTALEYGIFYAGDKFVDVQNKKCAFDSDEFKKLLEFAAKFPAEIDYEKLGEDSYSNYGSGQSLFMYKQLSGYTDYRTLKRAILGDEISYIGCPNDEGVNESVIIPDWRYAISAQCECPEVAWDFLKRFWYDDFYAKRNYEYGFPVTESGLKFVADNSMDNPYTINESGEKEYYTDSYPIGGTDVKITPLKQEEVDYLTDFILSVDKVDGNDPEIKKIVTEEAAAFFSGQKSADEVAKIIQNRASIYVNESN